MRAPSASLVVALLWVGCGPSGRPVPMDLTGPPPARVLAIAASEAVGDRWTVALDVDGPGPPALLLDDRPVRGCLRRGDRVTCRFPALRPGGHLLSEDRPDGVRVWGQVGADHPSDAIVFRLFPDRFRGGDPARLRDAVPWLVRLGVTALWLSPPPSQPGSPGHAALAEALAGAGIRRVDGPGAPEDTALADAALGFVTGELSAEALARALQGCAPGDGGLRAHALSTADGPGFLWRAGHPDRQKLAATLQLTMGGVPVVVQGDAVGQLRPGQAPAPPAWLPPAEHDVGMLAHYRRLIELRRRHPALSRGGHRTLLAAGETVVVLRWLEDAGGSVEDAAVVAVTRGTDADDVTFPLPAELSRAAPLRPALGPSAVHLGPTVRLTVPPGAGLVLATD